MQITFPVRAGFALAIGLALASAQAQDAAPAPDAHEVERVVRIERRAGDAAEDPALDAACQAAGAHCQIIRKRIEGRPMLGVILQPDDASGVRIAGVTPGGPAAAAGLRSGDVLVSVNGSPLDNADPDIRVTQARTALKGLTPGTPVAIRYVRAGTTSEVRITPRNDLPPLAWNEAHPGGGAHAPMVVQRIRKGGADIDIEGLRRAGVDPGAMQVIRHELQRIGADCKGPDCRTPMLMEAFRWNGLNLASVDAKLGRYFGAQRGVLVLSTGDVFQGLEAGDVIQRIDATDVDTPRAAMDALRARPADTRVTVTYLRDRTARTTQVSVPRMPDMAALVAPPAPPAPAAPPARPAPPSSKRPPAAPLAPPSPPPPPAPRAAASPASAAHAMRVGHLARAGATHRIVTTTHPPAPVRVD